ncbi:MAG: hypothetical protein ACLQCU_17495, partial [Acidimicrobiales bacterium]
ISNIYVLGFTGHPWPVEVGLALRSGAYFIGIGLVSGPAFGALGTVGRRRHSVAIALLAAGLFVFEPLAWLVYFWSGPGWRPRRGVNSSRRRFQREPMPLL